MAHVVRPLIHRPRWHSYRCSCAALNRILAAPLTFSTYTTIANTTRLSLVTPLSSFSFRSVHFRSRAIKFRDIQLPSDTASESVDDESESSEDVKKSRNEKKREARRAVRWGMQLASFSTIQIKRILRVAQLEQEVFDAIMVVKKLGRDVREGKRRQFNLIGKLLREVEPELMDNLIETTKESDKEKFVALFGSGSWEVKDDDYEAKESEDDDDDDEDEDAQYYNEVTTRWYDGLMNKDIGITQEIYSLPGVDFDRQELGRLVRRVQSIEKHQMELEAQDDKMGAKYMSAKRSLTRFLRGLAKQISAE